MNEKEAAYFFDSIKDEYCLIGYIYLSCNKYRIISCSSECSRFKHTAKTYDEIIDELCTIVHEDNKIDFSNKFHIKSMTDNYNNSVNEQYLEYRLLCSDGEYHWYATRVRLISDDDTGEAIAVMFAKHIDQKIQRKQQEEYYRNIIERIGNSYVAIIDIDLKNDIGTPVKLTNVSDDFFENRSTYDVGFKQYAKKFIVPEYYDTVLVFLSHDNLIKSLKSYDDIVNLDIQENIGGEYKWAKIQVQPARFENGIVTEVILSIKDIDEEKKKEESVRQEIKKRQEQLLYIGKMFYRIHIYIDVQSDTYKMIVFDDDETYNDILEGTYSKNMVKLCKHISQPYKELFLREASIENIRNRIAAGNTKPAEYYYQKKLDDGKIKNMVVSGYFNVSDLDDEVLISIRDVTNEEDQRRQLESALLAAKQANRAKSNFLSNMSHDMRTPMNAIVGMTSIAKVHMDDQNKVINCLEQIDISSQYLLQLINNVLDMSVIESGNIRLNENETNLIDVYEAVACIIMPMIKNSGINIRQRSYIVEHNNVIADELKIRQILINIFSNAIKYTNAGGSITVDMVESNSIGSDYSEYGIVISDTGIGMSSDFVKKIGQPFERAENSTLSKVHGTGLGMTITKTFIDLMGGDINIESEEGKGTTVSIVFRLRYIPDKVRPENTIESMDFSGMRVLVVEDNKVNRDIMKDYLNDVNVSYDMVNDGVDAVKLINRVSDGYYDIIFMDIQMPVMDGYEATLKIREMNRRYAKEVPIIALTANAFISDVKKSLDIGMDGHLAKPIMLNRLYNIIEKYYKKRKR